MISRHSALAALCLSVTLAACGGGDDTGAPAPASQQKSDDANAISVYIFAGQSNMNGSDAIIAYEATLDLVDIGQQLPVDRTALFTMSTATTSYAWGDIRGHDGFHFGLATLGGKKVKVHGPEVGFNRYLGGDIAIVKYASNYTALENGRSAWVKPGSRWTSWQSFVDQQLSSIGRPYRVAGFVWFQGIDDGFQSRTQEAYKADLVQVIADVRAKYGNVPVVIGRSVDSPIAPTGGMAPIRAAQVEVGSMPGNSWIDVDGLPLVADHHLTSPAQLEIGRRFGVEMERLQR